MSPAALAETLSASARGIAAATWLAAVAAAASWATAVFETAAVVWAFCAFVSALCALSCAKARVCIVVRNAPPADPTMIERGTTFTICHFVVMTSLPGAPVFTSTSGVKK